MPVIKNFTVVVLCIVLTTVAGACARVVDNTGDTASTADRDVRPADTAGVQPTLEVSPVEDGEGDWKIATADEVTLTVRARGAKDAKLLYRPVITSDDRFVELETIAQPTQQGGDTFQAQVKTPEDFAGEVWARVTYADGERETEKIALTTETAIGPPVTSGQTTGTSRNPASGNGSVGADESMRSDQVTGGRIVRTSLKQGRENISISINAPAFLLTLWQDGKEVKSYPVGIGLKAFPIPIGERTASRIILNPAWIPPNSGWVRQSSSVEPYERIPADDPRNPLGKIKIPLGNAYLIHEAAEPSDIGNLVSHGCIRMLTDDIFDLTKKIASARRLSQAVEKIDRARSSSDRMVLTLDEPLPVDINYDTAVVEAGVLHLYPDVYDRVANTEEKLLEELRSSGVDESTLDRGTLMKLIERVTDDEQFVVKIADIKAGRAFERGKTVPLSPRQAEDDSG